MTFEDLFMFALSICSATSASVFGHYCTIQTYDD